MPGLTLILNTAESHIQYALIEEGALLHSCSFLASKGGVEILAPTLNDAFLRMRRSMDEISRIACVAGPGNFTGLRIGLSTSGALARALGARQAGLDYLQCLAANAPARPGEETLVLVKARSGLAFSARFITDADGVPRKAHPARLIDSRGITRESMGSPAFVVGSGAEILPFRVPSLRTPLDTMPSVSSLMLCAGLIDWDLADCADIPPVYMRDCDAVENLAHISLSLGRDPARARSEFDRLVTQSPGE